MLLKIKSKFSDINISFVLCDIVLNVFVFLSKTNFMHISYILPTKQLLSCKQWYSELQFYTVQPHIDTIYFIIYLSVQKICNDEM